MLQTPRMLEAIKTTKHNLGETIDKLLKLKSNTWVDLKAFREYIENADFDSYVILIGGHQILGSLSPFMHTYCGFLAGKKVLYTLLDISSEPSEFLDEILWEIASNPHILGANITMPYKVKVFERLASQGLLDESALMAGAVNTIAKHSGTLKGYNTDIEGIYLPILEKLSWEKLSWVTHASVLGSWGAAKAAIVGLLRLWVKRIHVFNRTNEHLLDITNHFYAFETQEAFAKNGITNYSIELHEYEVDRDEKCDLLWALRHETGKGILVNTLPFGFKEHFPTLPIRKDLLGAVCEKNLFLFDVVYDMSYPETPLIGLAKAHLKTGTWRDMVSYQAKKGFELWTGSVFDAPMIRKMLGE